MGQPSPSARRSPTPRPDLQRRNPTFTDTASRRPELRGRPAAAVLGATVAATRGGCYAVSRRLGAARRTTRVSTPPRTSLLWFTGPVFWRNDTNMAPEPAARRLRQ
jgi:hypothetical protein